MCRFHTGEVFPPEHDVLMKEKNEPLPLESDPPRAATHGSVSEMQELRRNTCFRVHRQACRTQSSLQSEGEPALIRAKQTRLYLFSFA